MGRARHFFPEEEGHDEPLVNLTPLIDVVFVVLITFMIIAPVLEFDRVELAPKGPGKHPLPASSPLTITVRSDNTVWIGGEEIAIANLEARCRKEKSHHPGSVPRLVQDSRAAFGTYQIVKNTLEICGFEELDIILRPH